MKRENRIVIENVNKENWRDICRLKVKEDQSDFVAEPAYYLCLCSYGELWHPLAISLDGKVIGFIMWAIDDEDRSCWLGGIIIDRDYQNRGFGKRAIELTIEKLKEEQKPESFALSYSPENPRKKLYASLGFRETGEMEDDEIVARLK